MTYAPAAPQETSTRQAFGSMSRRSCYRVISVVQTVRSARRLATGCRALMTQYEKIGRGTTTYMRTCNPARSASSVASASEAARCSPARQRAATATRRICRPRVVQLDRARSCQGQWRVERLTRQRNRLNVRHAHKRKMSVRPRGILPLIQTPRDRLHRSRVLGSRGDQTRHRTGRRWRSPGERRLVLRAFRCAGWQCPVYQVAGLVPVRACACP